MSPNLLWIINSLVLFPENGEEMPTKLLQKSKKQVKSLIKIERYAANKPRKEIFNSITDVFTSFHVIYYKDPPFCYFFFFFCHFLSGRWLLSTKVTDSNQQWCRCSLRSLAGLRGQSLLRQPWKCLWWDVFWGERRRGGSHGPSPSVAFNGALSAHMSAPRPQRQDGLQIWDMFQSTQMTSAFTWSCDLHLMSRLFQALKGYWRWNRQDCVTKSPQGCGEYAEMRLHPQYPEPWADYQTMPGCLFFLVPRPRSLH